MAIVHQSSTTANGTGATATFSKPTGTVAGDLLLAWFAYPAGVTGAPSGWTQLVAAPFFGYAYYKVAGGSEPTSYSWTAGSSSIWNGGISRYSGVDNTTPIDVAATSGSTLGSTSIVAPSITTVTANAMLVGGGLTSAGTTFTPPAGLTEQWERTGGNDVEHASAVQGAAGASGTKTWALSSSDSGAVFLSALRPDTSTLQTITATGIASAEAFGSDSAQFAPIQPTGVPSGESFGAAALSPGVATINPAGIPSSEGFGTAALVTTGQIAGQGIPSGEAFGTASIHGAAVTITVPSIGSAEAFGTGQIVNDELDGDLILTWVVDKRANRVRLVFESTESMSNLRIRELEVWARSTGRQ